MSKAMWPIQVAIYGALDGAVAQIDGVTPVAIHDELPDDLDWRVDADGEIPDPFIVIGDSTSVPWRTFGNGGSEATITIHVWSKYIGGKEAALLMKGVSDVLDGLELPVAGYGTVLCHEEFAEILRDEDMGEPCRHGVIRFRIIVEEL